MSTSGPNPPEKSVRPIPVTLVRKPGPAAPADTPSASPPAPGAPRDPSPTVLMSSVVPPSPAIVSVLGASATHSRAPVTDSSELAPAPVPAGTASVADPSASIIPRPPTASERLSEWLTLPAVYVPIVIVAVTLLAWSFLVRWPNRPILVRARPLSSTVVPAGSGPTPSSEQLEVLRAGAAVTMTQVVTDRDRLPALIASIEQEARNAGFVTELTARLPFSPVPGVPELLRHPIAIRLENNYDRPEPAYVRFLSWMRRVSTLGVKTEFVTITLQSLGDGVASANVELHLMSLPASFDAKAPPK